MPDCMQKTMNETESFKTNITADQRLLNLHFREAFQYRDAYRQRISKSGIS